jgi:hypothetical protein
MPDVSEVKRDQKDVLELKPGADARIRAFLDGQSPTTSTSTPTASTPGGSTPIGGAESTDPVVTVPSQGASCG